MSTALLPIQRARLALSSADREASLVILAKQSVSIIDITNADAYEECNRARIVLKNERNGIEKIGIDARDDATKYAKAVITEKDRLIGFIQPEEHRLMTLQSEWNSKIEAEKAAKQKAEDERYEKLRASVSRLRSYPMRMRLESAETIRTCIEKLEIFDVTVDEYQELHPDALVAKRESLIDLQELLVNRIADDERSAQYEQARKILVAEKAQVAEDKRIHDAEVARAVAELQEKQLQHYAAIRKQEDALKLARDILEEERRKLAREETEKAAKQKAEADRAEQEAARVASQPEIERLIIWITSCRNTIPTNMQSVCGKSYVDMIDKVLEKAFHELNNSFDG